MGNLTPGGFAMTATTGDGVLCGGVYRMTKDAELAIAGNMKPRLRWPSIAASMLDVAFGISALAGELYSKEL